MDSSSLKILLGILLGVAASASAAQDSPTIGFISPDEQVDVGECFWAGAHYALQKEQVFRHYLY